MALPVVGGRSSSEVRPVLVGVAQPARGRGRHVTERVTCVVRATSRGQLDELYRALCDHPMVVMVL